VSDVVVAGHVSLDLRPRLYGPPQIGPGRLVVVGPAAFSTGGAVANTGLALHRLGVDVRLAGKVGDDLFGRALLEALEERRAGLSADMIVSDSEATSYTIVIEPPGADRSFLHCPGANESFSAQDVRYEQLAGVRLFHFGYPPLMPLMYADGGAELAEMLGKVRAAGPATCLDMCVPDPDSDAGRVDWVPVLELALPHVDVFAPSIDELLFMLDRRAYERLLGGGIAATVDGALLRRCSGRLIAIGAAVVAIKLGDQGLYLRTTADAARIGQLCARAGISADAWLAREVLSPCFVPRELVGATGSGDATIAGLLAALLRGADPIGAATAATAVGACSVEAIDPTSGIPGWPAVARRIDGGWKRAASELELGRERTAIADPLGTLDLGR
jgi:sugar/nucleoside kinase (ribokinase family)